MPVRYAIPVILFAAAAALPAFAQQSTVVAAIIIAFDCYLAQCWNLAAGYAGLFSLGHGIFLAIGAYTSTITMTIASGP